MNADQLPEGFAPYHLVCLDPVRVFCIGRYYDLGICATDLDHARRVVPEKSWGILSDGGLLDDMKITRKIAWPSPFDLRTASSPPMLAKFKIVRKAA